MKAEILNQTHLAHNTCFGCGHDNPHGLHIEIFRDEENSERLRGVLHPKTYMTGFPGITHGGLLYTALDCMGAWVPKMLRPGSQALWLLRTATLTYHKPAFPDQDIRLLGWIESEGSAQEAMAVHVEARDESDVLLADGIFKVIPVQLEKFKKITGIAEIPDNWLKFIQA